MAARKDDNLAPCEKYYWFDDKYAGVDDLKKLKGVAKGFIVLQGKLGWKGILLGCNKDDYPDRFLQRNESVDVQFSKIWTSSFEPSEVKLVPNPNFTGEDTRPQRSVRSRSVSSNAAAPPAAAKSCSVPRGHSKTTASKATRPVVGQPPLTKNEFDRYKSITLSRVSSEVQSCFRVGGFTRWGKDWLPVLEIGPFDVGPGSVREAWFDHLHNVSLL